MCVSIYGNHPYMAGAQEVKHVCLVAEEPYREPREGIELDHEVGVLGIAKGPDRKAGLERFFLGSVAVHIDGHSPAAHLLQHIRDEAHRFAITGHRQRRAKARNQSLLEGIAGVGAKKRRQLLLHFGSISAIKGASIEELSKVQGISKAIAADIYKHFH